MAAVHFQGAAQPVPAEPVGGFCLGALSVGPQPLVVVLGEAEAVQAHLDAVMVAHAADAPLGQRGREAVLEVRHHDGFSAGYDLAEFAGPEVADAQLVLQESRDGVAGAVRVGGGAGVRAEQGQHLSFG